MISLKQNADTFGAFASTLCLIHCIATPFIFIVHACSLTCCETSPLWWKSIDYIFLAISFFAIKQTVKNTTSSWIKPALWIAWSVMLIVIVNEYLGYLPLHDNFIYFPSLTLVALHLYNLKYCQCSKTKCCSNT